MDFAVNASFANAPGDQLGDLAAKVDDQDVVGVRCGEDRLVFWRVLWLMGGLVRFSQRLRYLEGGCNPKLACLAGCPGRVRTWRVFSALTYAMRRADPFFRSPLP